MYHHFVLWFDHMRFDFSFAYGIMSFLYSKCVWKYLISLGSGILYVGLSIYFCFAFLRNFGGRQFSLFEFSLVSFPFYFSFVVAFCYIIILISFYWGISTSWELVEVQFNDTVLNFEKLSLMISLLIFAIYCCRTIGGIVTHEFSSQMTRRLSDVTKYLCILPTLTVME